MDVSALGLSAPYASVLTVAVVVVPLVWVVGRSRSLFMVRHYLWRLLHRRPAGAEPWLDEAVRERIELVRFRALVMWADSLVEARRITAWAEGEGIDVGLLGDCGTYFNRRGLVLCDPLPPLREGKRQTKAKCLLLLAAILLTASMASGDAALLRLRHDHTWILASTVAASPLLGGTGKEMTLEDCKAGTDTAGFGEENRIIVCRTLAEKGMARIVKEGLDSQRLLLLALALGFAAVIASLQRKSAALRAAHAARTWLALDKDERTRHASGLQRAKASA